VSITKVVVFFTANPTKSVLYFSEFSTIFYAFYKFLQKGYTIEDVSLRLGPWKDLGPHNWVPRPTGRRARRRRSRPGNDSGSSACSPRTDWQPRLGRGSTLRRRTAVTGGDGRGGSGFQRGGRTGWTTRDARGTREVYGRRPTIWWLGTAWTKARRLKDRYGEPERGGVNGSR
jgi:hypothetical protein